MAHTPIAVRHLRRGEPPGGGVHGGRHDMGLMRWLRGGDENSATANAMGAGMAEIDALFRPSKHKQTEHIQESRTRRVDINNGAGSDVDLEMGVALIRRRSRGDDLAMATATADEATAADQAMAHVDDAAIEPFGGAAIEPADQAAPPAGGEIAAAPADEAGHGVTSDAELARAVATDSEPVADADAGTI